jgi:hypothetical protein
MITWWEWVIIIVGSILGALFLLSLIAFRTGARRSPYEYQSQQQRQRQEPLSQSQRQHERQRQYRETPLPDPHERAVREAIKTGLLMFNVPAEMIQGKNELVEIRIARSTELHEALITGVLGRGVPVVEPIDTSLYMEVKLSGPTFDIKSDSLPEQMIIPTPASWKFDVKPYRAGNRTITLIVNLRVEAEGVVGGRRSVSVLEKPIDVQVDRAFATRRFITTNWQWLIPTILALAGAIAAWLVVPF